MALDEQFQELCGRYSKQSQRLSELEGFERVFNSGSLLMFIFRESDGVLFAANDALLTLSGLTREQAIGKKSMSFIVNDMAAGCKFRQEIADNIHQEGKPYRREMVFTAADGHRCHFAFSFEEIEFQEQRCIMGVGYDFTQSRTDEFVLKLQRDLAIALASTVDIHQAAQLLLDTVLTIPGLESGGFYLIDQERGDLHLMAHRGLPQDFVDAMRYLRRDSQEAQDVHRGQPIYVDDPRAACAAVNRVAPQELVAVAIIPVKEGNRVVACINLGTQSLDNISPTLRYMIETIAAQLGQVISLFNARATMQKRAEEIKLLGDELSRINQVKDEVTALVNNDLRSPLMTGLGYVDMLLAGQICLLTDEAKAKLKIVQRNLQRLSGSIHELAKCCRLLNQQMTISPKLAAFDLRDLCNDVATEIFANFGLEKKRLQTNLSDESLHVFADRKLVKTAMLHLLNNAVLHAGQQANFWLEAKRDGKGEITVTVRDDGAGMSAAMQQHAFSPQLSGEGQAPALTMGLSIVKMIVEAHRSQVRLQSQQGKGTTVSFNLMQAARA